MAFFPPFLGRKGEGTEENAHSVTAGPRPRPTGGGSGRDLSHASLLHLSPILAIIPLGKQKCGSLWVVTHPQACAGERPPTQRPYGRTAFSLYDISPVPARGENDLGVCLSFYLCCAGVHKIRFLRSVGSSMSCTAFLFSAPAARSWGTSVPPPLSFFRHRGDIRPPALLLFSPGRGGQQPKKGCCAHAARPHGCRSRAV